MLAENPSVTFDDPYFLSVGIFCGSFFSYTNRRYTGQLPTSSAALNLDYKTYFFVMSNEQNTRWTDVIAVGGSPAARRIGSFCFIASSVTAIVFYFLIASGLKGSIEGHLIAITPGVAIWITSKGIRDFLHGRRIIDITRSTELRIHYLSTSTAEIPRRWMNFAIDSILLAIAFGAGLALCVAATIKVAN